MRSFRFACLVLCLLVLTFAISLAQQAPALITGPIDNTVRTILPNNVHPLAQPQYDQGEVPESLALHRMLLVLKRSDQQEAALRNLIENQQNKKSSLYHQWVTPEQIGNQFGLVDSDLSAVVAWLQANGFAIDSISNGRTVIEFDGTAGLVKKAFGTALHYYSINGEQHIANSTNPSIPTALAPVIGHINSLHNFFSKPQNVYVGKYNAKTRQLEKRAPGFITSLGGNTFYALGPYDFANIYDVISLWTAATPINGNGVTIAIVGRTDINPDDAPTFWSLFGLGQSGVPMPTLTIKTNGPDPGYTGDEGEADIDTQWSGAVAPGATIYFVTSATTETTDGVDLSALYIVDNNVAPVVSESYGNCEASGVGSFYGPLWEQGAAQGISAMVSTGDNGSAGCDDPDTETYAVYGRNVNGIASTPWNAAIGGTDFNQPTQDDLNDYWNTTNAPTTQQSVKNNTYIPELVWNDSCANPILQLAQGGSTSPLSNCNNSDFNAPYPSGLLDIIAGGGGASGSGLGSGLGWMKPEWQTGTGVPNDNARDLPDVSLFASNGFLGSLYVICQSDASPANGSECTLTTLLGYGGTSVASPAFAGIMALVNQKYGVQGVPGLVLYNLASKQSSAFHDLNIISGTSSPSSNAVPCAPGSTSDCTSSGQTYGVLSGYATNAGFDLASGLGSVDAGNLVTNWNSVTFTPTTTTLTLNNGNPVTNFTHGQSMPVTIKVAPQTGSGTPTGDAAILVAPGTPGNPGIDGFTLSGGTATGSTNAMPGGTYAVIAHYGGDTTFGGGYSSASPNITVNPESSTVSMPGVVIYNSANQTTSVGTTVTYGNGGFALAENNINGAYWLRADVFNGAGDSCQNTAGLGCPTGSVSFTYHGTTVTGSPFTLNSFGYTEDQSAQLPGGGTYALVANYKGDASYQANSATTNITVVSAATSVTVAASANSAFTNQNVTLTATVGTSSYGNAPTGTVTFYANGTALPTATLTPTNGSPNGATSASLAASLTYVFTTANTYNITAVYTTGDGNYSSQSNSNTVQVVVTSPQDVNVPSTLTNPAAANPGQTTSTTMQLSTADGNPFNSTVSFSCSGLPTGTQCSFSPTSISSGATTPQTVTVTISTVGPFSGTASGAAPLKRQRAGIENRRLWLPLSLPLSGIFFAGIAGRRVRRGYRIGSICLMLMLAAFLIACGGGGGSSSTPVTVSVSPATVNNLFPNLSGAPTQSATFTATVTGTTNPTVTWAAAGVTGGNTTVGTISGTGTTATYTAPAALPSPANVSITATVSGATSPGSATVNLQTPTAAGTFPITVTVTKVSGSSNFTHNTTFNLTVN
jgi:hypothetical protein